MYKNYKKYIQIYKHPTLFLPPCPTPGCRTKNLEHNCFFHVFPGCQHLLGLSRAIKTMQSWDPNWLDGLVVEQKSNKNVKIWQGGGRGFLLIGKTEKKTPFLLLKHFCLCMLLPLAHQ